MIIRVGLENRIEGRSLALALDFPGCYAYGKDASTCLVAVPSALLQYERWIAQHSPSPWLALGNFDVRLVDVWEVYKINSTCEENEKGDEINAWFVDDWRPLESVEIERGLAMLDWSRADLLSVVSGQTDPALDVPRGRDNRSIRGVLEHIARAEAWYLDRIGLYTPRIVSKPDSFAHLETMRSAFRRQLPALAGSKLVTGKDGEFWSPRKVLRRAIWHERDHTEHVLKLLGILAE
jgi:hypothetical protein